MKRAISLITAFALALALLPAAALAASPAFGSDVWLKDTVLQESVTYSENIFWSSGYDKPRHEYYFTYTPGIGGALPSAWGGQSGGSASSTQWNPEGLDLSWLFPNQDTAAGAGPEEAADGEALPEEVSPLPAGVRPVASFGSSVCARSTVSEAAQKYESLGYRVVGAINGDFYDMATGYPLGILVSDGELLSGSPEYYAVGFRADGSAVMGAPNLTMTAVSSGGYSVKLASLNKPRVDKAGVTMLTYDYRDDHTTGPSVETDGINALATIIGGRASIGETLTLLVQEVSEDALPRTLAENQVLLTGASNGYDTGLAFLRSLTPGQTVTVSFTTADTRWNDVTEAVGAYDLLVENGTARDDFKVSADPHTAIGMKANGEVIFYTLDGRQNSVSMGSSLGVLAKRMVELGCVTALNLDGGGSTTAVAAMPDSTSAKLLNSPSDKSQRKVSNHLLLLAPGNATGEPSGVYLSAASPAVLTGHTVKLTANVTDTHYFPMNLPLHYAATAGEVSNGVFTAPMQSGTATVSASYDLFTAQQNILVLDAPGSMTVRAKGSSAASLSIIAGGTAQLSVSALYNHLPLEIFPEDVNWSVDPNLGSIDEHGLFTASEQAGSGTITATRGTVWATLPVTVEANHPFVDLEGHWAEPYMGSLYQQQILTGEYEGEQLYARPDRGLSRAEFSVLLARYLGLDTEQYAGKSTVFTDLEGVDAWAGPAIRAMYELGVVNGTDATHFSPQEPLQRAQAAAMLGRALHLTAEEVQPDPDTGSAEPPAGTPVEDAGGLPAEEPDGSSGEPPLPDEPVLPPEEGVAQAAVVSASQTAQGFDAYPDADQVPEYALAYFKILIDRGALDGRDGKLLPAASITRAEICKALVVMQAE